MEHIDKMEVKSSEKLAGGMLAHEISCSRIVRVNIPIVQLKLECFKTIDL